MDRVEPSTEGALEKARLLYTSLQIDVDGDKVILNGFVKAWSERSLIARAAWSASGVRIVEDKLVVR